MAFHVGATIDRYTLESVLGDGGMGKVYRAYDSKLQRYVALKVLRPDKDKGSNTTGSSDPAGRILREARAAAALDHPNAVAIFDVGEVDGALYLAMELVSGRPLRAYMGDESVPVERRVRWLLDVAKALSAAHDRGLVHRDVKPENIMVRDDGVIKVVDFGIAKKVNVGPDLNPEAAGSATTQTVAGTIVGTPLYMAPEQIRGEPLDGRADQFAWAVVAYELLTGRGPWQGGGDGIHLLLTILDKMPVAPSNIAPAVSPLVDAVVMRAMSKSADARFANMTVVVSALEPYVSGSHRLLEGLHPSGRITVENVATAAPSGPLAQGTTTDRSGAASPGPGGTTLRSGGSGSTKSDLPGLKVPIAVTTAPGKRSINVLALGLGAAMLVSGTAAFLVGRTQRDAASVTGKNALGAMATTAESSGAGLREGAGIAITDVADPTTGSKEALSAYQAALQAYRDGNFEAAQASFQRASDLDPGFAAAHLRLALLDSLVSSDELEARKSYKRATQHRGALSPRDQAILDAMEPYLQRDPSDLVESTRRLEAATKLFPRDAELRHMLGIAYSNRGAFESATAAFAEARTLDPRFAEAFANEAGTKAYKGDWAGAREGLERCFAVSPAATECLWFQTQLDEAMGDCDAYEATVRRWIAKDPEDYYGYQLLGRALAAQGRSLVTVRAAYEQKWARVPAERRARAQHTDAARIALFAGDFALAEKEVHALEELVVTDPGALAHAIPATLLLDVYTETDRPADARKVAGEFLERKDAWVTPHRVDDLAIYEDMGLEMARAAVLPGPGARAEMETHRQRWLSAWRGRTSKDFLGYLWVAAYARPAQDEEDGKLALASLASFGALPQFTPQTMAQGNIGHAFLLGGRPGDALVHLESAVSACMAVDEPVAHARAFLDLGTAREALGDTAKACKAYASVIAMWGSAKPKSRTADAARKRVRALGCKG